MAKECNKYTFNLPENIPIEAANDLERKLYDATLSVTSNCNSCTTRQKLGEDIFEITQSNITMEHMARTDSRTVAALARIYNCPELEKAAIEFSTEYCGKCKEKCLEGRETFSGYLFSDVKEALDDLKQRRNKSSSRI